MTHESLLRRTAAVLAMLISLSLGTSRADAEPPLVLEAKIPLGDVSGRIDHMAIDAARGRLFVAELGNDSVGVVDLDAGKLLRRIGGLAEPQGVGYVRSTDMLYVANGDDGSVRLFKGTDLTAVTRLCLGDDADNLRVDPAAGKVLVGYGSGGLAVIDPYTAKKIADVALKAHPEAFQLDAESGRAFVNLPNAGQIAIVDLAAYRVSGALPLKEARSNFPMALDREAGNLLVVTRAPPRLLVFALNSLSPRPSLETCGDADDVFTDAKRRRVYVSCGAGYIDVFERSGDSYQKIARLPTVSGARTSYFDTSLDRLFLAVRTSGHEPAAIWVFKPQP